MARFSQTAYSLATDPSSRAALLDRLDAVAVGIADGSISDVRIAALDRLINDLTAARAANLDATVSSRAAAADYSAGRAALLDRLDAIDPAAADGALSAARMAALDRLINDLTAARAANLDNARAWLRDGTTVVPIVRPYGAVGIDLAFSGAGAWQFGAYVQLVAANDLAAHVMLGLLFRQTYGWEWEVEVAIGGAGSEVALATIGGPAPVDNYLVPFPVPLQIPANARVALRARNASGEAANTMVIDAKGVFAPRPV